MKPLSFRWHPALLGRFTLTLVLLGLTVSLWKWGQGGEEAQGTLRLTLVDPLTGQVTPARL